MVPRKILKADVECDSSVSGRPLSHTGTDSIMRNSSMLWNTISSGGSMLRNSRRSRLAAKITCYDQAGLQVIFEAVHKSCIFYCIGFKQNINHIYVLTSSKEWVFLMTKPKVRNNCLKESTHPKSDC